MIPALLDTSVVIGAVPDLTRLPEVAAISVVTLGELRAGVLRTKDARARAARERRVAAICRAFLGLPVDEVVADRYGEVLALAREERRTTKATDLLIIATALAHGRALFTLDERQAALAIAAGAAVGG